jgi:TPR repeat protein
VTPAAPPPLPDVEVRCTGGSWQACDGVRYRIATQDARALERYTKACPKDPTSCAYAGDWIFAQGDKADRALGEPIKWYQRACKAGSRYGCERYGWSLPDRSPEELAVYMDLCKRDWAPGCSHAAYLLGHGTPARDRLATELYVKACDLGNLDACWHAALELAYAAYAGTEEQARAREKADAACTAGNAAACSILDTIHRCGKGVPCDAARAARYAKRAKALEPEPPAPPDGYPGGLARISRCTCDASRGASPAP